MASRRSTHESPSTSSEGLAELTEGAGPVLELIPNLLLNERREATRSVLGGRVIAPLFQSFPLGGIIQVLTPFSLDNPEIVRRPLDDEVRVVVGDAALGVPVLDPKCGAL